MPKPLNAQEEPEQEYLEGMAPKRIDAVHRAALKVVKFKGQQKELSELVKDAEALLIEQMVKHKCRHYQYGSITVVLDSVEKATVKMKRQAGEGEEEE